MRGEKNLEILVGSPKGLTGHCAVAIRPLATDDD
jgi:hypothetical protein